MSSPADNRRIAETLAAELGFDAWGFAPAGPLTRAAYYRQWLAGGRAGTMAYLHRHGEMRTNASELLPGARTVMVFALNYHQPASDPPPTREPRGRIAMYAWGRDYHKVVKAKLFALVDRLRESIRESFEAKVCVDTAPLIEREYAMLAGLGWIGKNTMVLNQRLGSYFFLGEVVTTLEIACDQPAIDHCGTCRRCLDACPTGAFPAAYEMDASRCISYLTIEHRGSDIPGEFHEGMGDWIFGCDVCQQVCPYNQDAPPTREPQFAIRPPGPAPPLEEVANWTDDECRKAIAGTAINRARAEMLRRNARIALSNLRRGTT